MVLVELLEGVVNAVYRGGVRVVEGVVVVVGGVCSNKGGKVGVVLDIEYSRVIV